MDGFVWSVVPVVVGGSAGRLELFRAAGTTCWWPSHPRGERRPFDQVTQRAEPWAAGRMAGLLTLVDPGADYSVSLMWHQDWSFWGWYIDFIRPYRETPIGWDFSDIHLDLIVAPDGTATVKDEEEITVAVEHGEVTVEERDAAYRRCEQLIVTAARGAGVFGEPWPQWRPDPAWPRPSLSEEASRTLQDGPTPENHRLDRDWWLA